MPDLLIASIQHNCDWAAREQIRLFKNNLTDSHELIMVDNSTDPGASAAIRDICAATGTMYLPVPGLRHEHPDGLNFVAGAFRSLDVPDGVIFERGQPDFRRGRPSPRYIGFVDHDVFPRSRATVIDLIRPAGFFGIGQRHRPTGSRYVKPSFCFFDRQWLGGRALNFDGIRAADKADDGDCASMLAPLFSDEDWLRLPHMEHGYTHIREMDSAGLQSWAIEVFGNHGEWIHLFNLSRWLAVPDPDERERLVREMVEAL